MLLAAAALVGIPAFFAGRVVKSSPRNPIDEARGVPVGDVRTRAGAVAAAESYLATEQSTVERSPGRFHELVTADYLPRLQTGALAAARADRLHDVRGMALWDRGGESFTVIGSARLDWYRGDGAEITTWAGQIFWGPGQEPAQTWSLTQTTLVWRTGRWRVSAMNTLPEAAPSPAALPQASGSDDTIAILGDRLAGFTSVGYGAPG